MALRNSVTRVALGAAVVTVFGLASVAQAEMPEGVIAQFYADGAEVELNIDAPVWDTELGKWHIAAVPASLSPDFNEVALDIYLTDQGSRADMASVDANLAATNTSGGFQTFGVLVTAPLSMVLGPNVTQTGDVAMGVTDLLGDGATAQNSGLDAGGAQSPIFQGLIDGAFTYSAWDSGQILSALPNGTNSVADPSLSPLAGPQANSTISIWLQFELSTFDSGTLSGTYEITSVPAPAVLPALAVFGLVARRRRRD